MTRIGFDLDSEDRLHEVVVVQREAAKAVFVLVIMPLYD